MPTLPLPQNEKESREQQWAMYDMTQHDEEMKQAYQTCKRTDGYCHCQIEHLAQYHDWRGDLPLVASKHQFPPLVPMQQLVDDRLALGLQSPLPIPADTIIGEFNGEFVASVPSTNNAYTLDYKLSTGEMIFINAEHQGGLMRFVNHSCSNPYVEIHAQNEREETNNGFTTRLFFVTIREIAAGEFLSITYERITFNCECGSEDCVQNDTTENKKRSSNKSKKGGQSRRKRCKTCT